MSKFIQSMRWSGLALAAVIAITSAGCASNDEITADKIRSAPSPEMEGMVRTHEQRDNDFSKTMHVNGRQIWDDIDMIMLWDRPSRLSRYPVP